MSETVNPILTRVAEAIAASFLVDATADHQAAAAEAILVIADELRSLDSDGEDGVHTEATAGFLVEVAMSAFGPVDEREMQRFMEDIAEMTGPDGEIYGHRD